MAELRVWQRRHGSDIVAAVTPVPGVGTWDVCFFREPGRRELRDGGRFGLLIDAHAAADALACATFGHRCEQACGSWNPIERRSPKRRGEAPAMNGRITRLIDDQQFGTIAGEDGADYAFDSHCLLGTTFGALHVGAPVTFVPAAATKRAAAIRIAVTKIDRR
jgi:hypothetical protein